MCTLDNQCYTITNENGFFPSEEKCYQSINEFISTDNFAALYQNFDDALKYNVVDKRCINWKEQNI